MMTLDEAILHAEQAASHCDACGQEHAQLAKWLRELRNRRELEMRWIADSDEYEREFEMVYKP